MLCCKKLFKSSQSFDLPIIQGVQGNITTRKHNDDFIIHENTHNTQNDNNTTTQPQSTPKQNKTHENAKIAHTSPKTHKPHLKMKIKREYPKCKPVAVVPPNTESSDYCAQSEAPYRPHSVATNNATESNHDDNQPPIPRSRRKMKDRAPPAGDSRTTTMKTMKTTATTNDSPTGNNRNKIKGKENLTGDASKRECRVKFDDTTSTNKSACGELNYHNDSIKGGKAHTITQHTTRQQHHNAQAQNRDVRMAPRPQHKIPKSAYDEIISISSSGSAKMNGEYKKHQAPPVPSVPNGTTMHAQDENALSRQSTAIESATSTLQRDSDASPKKSQDILNPPVQMNVRKEGVISERPAVVKKGDKEFQIAVYEKDVKTEELIRKAIVKNDFLNNMMDAGRLEAVVKSMKQEVFEANTFIIKEGETGSHFYVSAQGSFEVIKDGETIKSFGAGVVFGELAILYKAKRFASVKVTSRAMVWALERRTFQRIMMRTERLELEQNIKFLQSVSVLKNLSHEYLTKVADLLRREFYATGTTIIRQGDPGDKFYIIRGGSVTVTKNMPNGQDRVVALLKRGEYFGEQALINQDKRLANIIANESGTECLTLDRVAFNDYLGRVEDLMKMPVDTFPADEEIVSPKRITIINKEFASVQFNDLDLIGTLGVGGFGRVELVRDRPTKKTFALKKLKKYEMINQGQVDHVYSEKEIMAICNSPFIVQLYKTFKDNKYVYFLIEPSLGGDVWALLQRNRFFDEISARFITGCVVEALAYLHSRNIIYRDLKPENLMLDAEGYVKLVDFGFAKRIGPNHKTWTFAGTPEYVAPEIILNKGHDRAVDYWALGVLVHELLVGKPPFRGKDHMRTYSAILRGIDVVQMSQRIPKPAQVLIKGLCRQSAAERIGYQKKGIMDIKKHQWFDSFDWEKLQKRKMAAPIKRPLRNDSDLTYFDEYPKDRDDPPDEMSGWDDNF